MLPADAANTICSISLSLLFCLKREGLESRIGQRVKINLKEFLQEQKLHSK